MNSKSIIIDTSCFENSVTLEWWKLHKDIYVYHKIWDDISFTALNKYQSYIKTINNPEELFEKLVELSPSGILIFTEDQQLKNTIKSHIKQIIKENNKTGKITNIGLGDYLLYDTPKTSLFDGEVSWWTEPDREIEDIETEFVEKYVDPSSPYA